MHAQTSAGFLKKHAFLLGLRRRYGAPISRKRIFLIMVREDCLASDVQNYDFGDFIQGKLDGMKLPASKVGWNLC